MGNILRFGKAEDGQYKVEVALSAFPDEAKNKLKEYIDHETSKDKNFKKICDIDGSLLRYTSETLLPDNAKYNSWKNKKRILMVLGNPAIHSIKNRMFFFSTKNEKRRHTFWSRLDKADLLPNIYGATLKDEANERRELIKNGNGYNDFVVGLTTFYSLPTPVGTDARGVERLFKPVIATIREEEYERIKSYSFSKGAILIFTQKSSYDFVMKDINDRNHSFKGLEYWPIRNGSRQDLLDILAKY